MAKCQKCGSENDDDAVYCINCGINLIKAIKAKEEASKAAEERTANKRAIKAAKAKAAEDRAARDRAKKATKAVKAAKEKAAIERTKKNNYSQSTKTTKSSKPNLKKLWNKQNKNRKLLIGFFSIILIGFLIYFANGGFTNTKHYEDNTISFDYIEGWQIKKADGKMGRMVTGAYDSIGHISLSVIKSPTPINNLNEFKTSWEEGVTSNNNIIKSTKQITVDGTTAFAIDSTITENKTEINQYSVLLIKNNIGYMLLFSTESDLHSYRRSINTMVDSFHIK